MTVREMKDSGVEWIGLIPEHWGTLSLQYLLSFSGSGTTPKRLDMLVCEDGNGINWLNTGDLTDGYIENIPQKLKTEVMHQYSTLRLYPSGSLVIALYGATAGKLGILLEPSTTNQACCVLVPNKDLLNLKYLFYQLFAARSSLISLAKGGGQPNISQETVRKFKLCFTDLQEQKKIANFLDSKCAEIDALKADIEKQIETLQEYKKSVITEAVTKGLDPNVEMKISGCNWIGQIPKAWTESKVKLHLKRRTVRNPSPGNTEILSLYREYGVIPKNSRDDNHNVTSADTSKYLFVRRGDFVINKMKAWQGSVALSSYEGVVSPAYFVYEFISDQLDKQYLHYLLRSCYKDEFRRLSAGIREGQWDLSPESFSNLLLILPSLEEQIEISQYLETILPQIDKLIRDKGNQLETLAQYKQSLIYEYVTGKKAVPASF